MALLCAHRRYLPAQHCPTPIPKYQLQNSTFLHFQPKPSSSSSSSSVCYFSSNLDQQPTIQGFCALESDPPWEGGSVWSNMALYFFSLHVPLSFGGLSVLSQLLDQPNLHPQTKAVGILGIEILESFGALLLLQFTARTPYKPVGFKFNKTRHDRNWVFAAFLGFVILVVAIFLTSHLADRLFDSEGVNNQTLKDILSSGTISQAACTLLYCVVSPLLEEVVYRGFLLTSLASTMKWHQAVIVSSVIFSVSHLSPENFIQLSIVGVVLGCSYCWTGDLRSSILLHSLYNAFTLLVALYA